MPFNPAQFVFQPRPLQQFDFGAGFRDLAEGRMQRSRMAETTAQRQDTNSLNAANFAKDRGNTEYDKALAKQQEGAKLADAARSALQANDLAAAEALGPSLLEMGGKFQKDAQGNYVIEAPTAPVRSPLDFKGVRNDIYGEGGPRMGQPFSMPSPGGPGGQMLSESSPFGPRENPMDPPSLPGLSAAAAGPQPPPEEPQPELLGGSPVEAAPDTPQPQAAGGEPPQPTGPNPFGTPAFSPYSINMGDVVARNRRQLQPHLEGMQKAVPGRFGDRMREFTSGVNALGMSPQKALATTQPQLEQMAGLWRGELAAEGQAGRLAMQQGALEQREEDRRFANDLKLRDRAEKGADKIVALQSLQQTNQKYQSGRDAEDLLASAVENPTSANALIEQLYRMRNTGVMTDTDYTNARSGVVSLHQAVKNGVVEMFLKEHGGLNPDTTKMMKEYLDIAMQGHRRKLAAARDGLYRQWKHAKTEVERDAIEGKMRGFFPEEFYPAEFNDNGVAGEYIGPGDAEEPLPAAPASLDVGKKPVPRTLDGSGPKVSPNGVLLVPGRIGKKPPRDPKKLTDAQLDATNEDELMDMLRGASGAP